MLAIGIIIALLSLIGLALILSTSDDLESFFYVALLTLFLLLGILIITGGVIRYRPNDYSLKNYKMEREVRSQIVNGKEVSNDTVYIFTLKKDKS